MTDTLSRRQETETSFYNKYATSPVYNLHETEMKLFKIFEDEVHSDNPVLLTYKPRVIYKTAKYITSKDKKCAAIGIAGETASGKSTVTYDIIDTLEGFAGFYGLGQIVTRVNTDDYYYDRSEEVKKAGGMAEFAKNYDFDVPEALELDLMYKHIKELSSGKSVMLPKYDMSGTTIRTDNCIKADPSKIIISEGLFTLTEKIKDAFDFKIYVDIDAEVQKERFFIRAEKRGLGESARSIYENASEKAGIYIRPCRDEADIVLSGGAERSRYKVFLNKILSVIEQVNCLERSIR